MANVKSSASINGRDSFGADYQRHVACLCITYKRPEFLRHAVESFIRQDYPNRELIILDDADQYPTGTNGDGWKIVSTPCRYKTLGDKRNAIVGLVSDETELLAVWDDDDIYLPWHLSAAVEALRRGDVSRPSICWICGRSSARNHANRQVYIDTSQICLIVPLL